jgi:shikimate kinase
MNLVLIGYRGTGKSTIARILRDRLGMPLVSLDAAIEVRTGQRIRDFVEANGWDAFRDIESECCRELAGRDGSIIDAGGGVVLRAQNVDLLKRNGIVVWLRATTESIAGRIGADDNRPSLSGTKSFVDEIEEVMGQRRPLYESAADLAIDTDGRGPDEIASEIVKLIEGRVSVSKTD